MIYHNNTAEHVSLLIRHEAALRSSGLHNEQRDSTNVIKLSNLLWTLAAVVASLILL
jgi:hypothetical protein